MILLLATIWAMRDTVSLRADALDRAWTDVGRRLARAGVARRPNEGPLDLLSRARSELPASAAALSGLVQDYVALRYGAMEPVPERVRVFTHAVRNFRVRRSTRHVVARRYATLIERRTSYTVGSHDLRDLPMSARIRNSNPGNARRSTPCWRSLPVRSAPA